MRSLLEHGFEDLKENGSRLPSHVKVARLVCKEGLAEALLSMLLTLSQSILSLKLHTALENLFARRRTNLAVLEDRTWPLPETAHRQVWLEIRARAQELTPSMADFGRGSLNQLLETLLLLSV